MKNSEAAISSMRGGVGSKKFEDWGVKDFRTRGLPIWGGATFDWRGGAVPHYMP